MPNELLYPQPRPISQGEGASAQPPPTQEQTLTVEPPPMQEPPTQEQVLTAQGQDAALAQTALYALLERKAALYAGQDCSMPTETAQALLQSIQFLLSCYAAHMGTTPMCLLYGDAHAALYSATQYAERAKARAFALYRAARQSQPKLGSVSLAQTLDGIGLFFKRYDVQYFAHQIPCDIDYPLCIAVDEEKAGVMYITEYLRRICYENAFVQLFDMRDARALLNATMPDYQELLANIFEPILTNALGRVILGLSVPPLHLDKAQQAALLAKFWPMPQKQARALWAKAAVSLCAALGIGAAARAYLLAAADTQYPRLAAAVGASSVAGVFIAY